MASKLFFDPMRLIYIAPLASTTGSLVYATSELIFNSALVQPETRSLSDKGLPRWFSHIFNRGVCVVLSLNMTTIASTIASIVLIQRRGSTAAQSCTAFYWAGLAAAIGHLTFVPWVAPAVQGMVEDKSEEGASKDMEKWLGYHRLRMVVADLPAWLASIAAVMTVPL